MTTTVRQRRRATAIREILDAAHAEIVANGPAGLSLRAVARALGMTVQAVYHYFPSRNELLTALIAETYHELSNAVQSALDAATEVTEPRFVTAAEAFRSWALENVARFQLLYGTPLVNYSAPDGGPTTTAAGRLGDILVRELFAEESPARTGPPGSNPEHRVGVNEGSQERTGWLPPGRLSVFISAWGHMHGLISLEVFGHTSFAGPLQAELFHEAMKNLANDPRGRISTG